MPVIYTLEFSHPAERQFKALSKDLQLRMKKRLLQLETNPYGLGEKLQGATDRYRIRIGDYRAIYQVQNRELIVLVVRIGHRGEVYRQLPRVK